MSYNKIVTFVILFGFYILYTTALTCYKCEEKRDHATGAITGSCSKGAWVQETCSTPTLTHCITSRENRMSNVCYFKIKCLYIIL